MIQQVQIEPALIRHVATLEQLQLSQKLLVPDCERCIPSLLSALWDALPSAVPEPISRQERFQDSQQSVIRYSQFLKNQNRLTRQNQAQERQK